MITKEDIPALRRLWQEAFGDSDTFLDKFFGVGFSVRRCDCIRENGKIAAALYWFDCLWKGKKVAYIYAVATDMALRGRGLCRRLMEDTHRHLCADGYSGAVLVPGDTGLSALYAKFGYREFCPVKKAASQNIVAAKEISPEEYKVLRQKFLGENAIFQGVAALNFLATYGGFYKTAQGAFCGYRDGDIFHFEEILAENALQQEDSLSAMYLALDEDPALPDYFAIPLN